MDTPGDNDYQVDTGLPIGGLVDSPDLSYVQPTLVDRVKAFFAVKVSVDHNATVKPK